MLCKALVDFFGFFDAGARRYGVCLKNLSTLSTLHNVRVPAKHYLTT